MNVFSVFIKKKVLKACVVCISADSIITVDEAEILRAVADTLDCPIPPIIPRKIEQAQTD